MVKPGLLWKHKDKRSDPYTHGDATWAYQIDCNPSVGRLKQGIPGEGGWLARLVVLTSSGFD